MKLFLGFFFAVAMLPSISTALTLDCRIGQKYWESSKGLRLNVATGTAQKYADYGSEDMGGIEPIICESDKTSLACHGEKFTLSIPDLNAVEHQLSSDSSDLLGGLFGGSSGKYVEVVPGILATDGLLFDRSRPVVCKKRN